MTITGTNFASGATVTFGGTAATSVVVVNGTTITATTPAHAAGAVTVTVTVERPAREPDQRIHLHHVADGQQCIADLRSGGGRNGGDDHGHELCRGRDGDVWRDGGDQRGGSEQYLDHGNDAGARCGRGDGDGDGERPARKPD